MCFLFRFCHELICNLCALILILNLLYYQYWEGLIDFVQLIVPDLFVFSVYVYCVYNFVVNFDNFVNFCVSLGVWLIIISISRIISRFVVIIVTV